MSAGGDRDTACPALWYNRVSNTIDSDADDGSDHDDPVPPSGTLNEDDDLMRTIRR